MRSHEDGLSIDRAVVVKNWAVLHLTTYYMINTKYYVHIKYYRCLSDDAIFRKEKIAAIFGEFHTDIHDNNRGVKIFFVFFHPRMIRQAPVELAAGAERRRDRSLGGLNNTQSK
jgi:hypothetical protein